jgi:hypothetical protein
MGEMKRTTDEIQREISRIRDSLAENVHALEVTVRRTLDWRRPIRERPLQFVGGALVLGFVLGMI